MKNIPIFLKKPVVSGDPPGFLRRELGRFAQLVAITSVMLAFLSRMSILMAILWILNPKRKLSMLRTTYIVTLLTAFAVTAAPANATLVVMDFAGASVGANSYTFSQATPQGLFSAVFGAGIDGTNPVGDLGGVNAIFNSNLLTGVNPASSSHPAYAVTGRNISFFGNTTSFVSFSGTGVYSLHVVGTTTLAGEFLSTPSDPIQSLGNGNAIIESLDSMGNVLQTVTFNRSTATPVATIQQNNGNSPVLQAFTFGNGLGEIAGLRITQTVADAGFALTNMEITTTPEPASLALLGVASACALGFKRRRMKRELSNQNSDVIASA